MKKRTKRLLGIAVIWLLYAVFSGGGIVVERSDSLADLGAVARVQLTEETSVYLKQKSTTKRFYIPLLFYYYRNTYPFQLRYYGSTQGSSTIVANQPHSEYTTSVVVTDVTYYQKEKNPAVESTAQKFHASSWDGIIIPEPGEWIVESKGYVITQGEEEKPLTFPTMVIRETEHGRISVSTFIQHFMSSIP